MHRFSRAVINFKKVHYLPFCTKPPYPIAQITPIQPSIKRNFSSILENHDHQTEEYDFNVNKLNKKINHFIQDAKTLQQMLEIHSSMQDDFNLINYSVLFNKLSKMNTIKYQPQGRKRRNQNQRYDRNLDLNKFDQNDVLLKLGNINKNDKVYISKLDFAQLLIGCKKRLVYYPHEITGRKLVNILFYICKMAVFSTSITSKFLKKTKGCSYDVLANPELTTLIDMILDSIPNYLTTCNNQELANICYSLSKLQYDKGVNFLAQNSEFFASECLKCDLRAFSVIIHAYLGLNSELIDQEVIHNMFAHVLLHRADDFYKMNALDYSTILFFVCKANLGEHVLEELLSELIPYIPVHISKFGTKAFSSLCHSLSNIPKESFSEELYLFIEQEYLKRLKNPKKWGLFKRNSQMNCNLLLLLAKEAPALGSDSTYITIYQNVLEKPQIFVQDFETLLYCYRHEKFEGYLQSRSEDPLKYLKMLQVAIGKSLNSIKSQSTFYSMVRLIIGIHKNSDLLNFHPLICAKLVMLSRDLLLGKDPKKDVTVIEMSSLLNLLFSSNKLIHKNANLLKSKDESVRKQAYIFINSVRMLNKTIGNQLIIQKDIQKNVYLNQSKILSILIVFTKNENDFEANLQNQNIILELYPWMVKQMEHWLSKRSPDVMLKEQDFRVLSLVYFKLKEVKPKENMPVILQFYLAQKKMFAETHEALSEEEIQIDIENGVDGELEDEVNKEDQDNQVREKEAQVYFQLQLPEYRSLK